MSSAKLEKKGGNRKPKPIVLLRRRGSNGEATKPEEVKSTHRGFHGTQARATNCLRPKKNKSLLIREICGLLFFLCFGGFLSKIVALTEDSECLPPGIADDGRRGARWLRVRGWGCSPLD